MKSFDSEQIKFLEDLIFNKLISASKECPLRKYELFMRHEIKKMKRVIYETEKDNTTS